MDHAFFSSYTIKIYTCSSHTTFKYVLVNLYRVIYLFVSLKDIYPTVVAEWSTTLVQIKVAINPLQTQVTVCTLYYPMALHKGLPAIPSCEGSKYQLYYEKLFSGEYLVWLISSGEGNLNKTVYGPGDIRNPGKTACTFSRFLTCLIRLYAYIDRVWLNTSQ